MPPKHAYRSGQAPLGSVEGYIRQLIGWRDYIWHVYWHFGRGYRRRNALEAHGRLPKWFADLDSDAVEARCLKDVLAASARSRLGAPHSAADGVVQLRTAARLEPGRGHRLVSPLLRRRLRMGDGCQRGRHVPARRRRTDGDQAVHLRRRLHQSDERLLRGMQIPARASGSAIGHAHSPAATGRFWTATPNTLPTTNG